MFSFLRKKTFLKEAVFAIVTLLLLTGLLCISCKQPTDDPGVEPKTYGWTDSGGNDYKLVVTEAKAVSGNYSLTITLAADNSKLTSQGSYTETDGKFELKPTGTTQTLVLKITLDSSGNVTGVEKISGNIEFEGGFIIEGSPGSVDPDPETAYVTAAIPEELKGTWKETWSDVIISTTEFITSTAWGGYKGSIEGHRSNGSGAGYITIKYTENDDDPSSVGKYYVIHYEELTPTTMSYSGAYNGDDPDFDSGGGGKATKAEAEAAYTVTNEYFAIHTPVVKMDGGVPFPNAIEGDWEGDGYYDIYITNTTVEVNMMGMMPVFIGEIVDGKDEGDSGYLVFKYSIIGSGMGPESLIGRYSVLAWKDFDGLEAEIAVGGTTPNFLMSSATSQATAADAVSVYITSGYASLDFDTYELEGGSVNTPSFPNELQGTWANGWDDKLVITASTVTFYPDPGTTVRFVADIVKLGETTKTSDDGSGREISYAVIKYTTATGSSSVMEDTFSVLDWRDGQSAGGMQFRIANGSLGSDGSYTAGQSTASLAESAYASSTDVSNRFCALEP